LDTQDENRQPEGDASLIVPWIPDFTGYSDVNQRKKTDSLIRAYICRRLGTYKTTLEEIIQTVAAEKRLDLLSDYDGLIQDIEHFRERLDEPPEDCGDFFDLDFLPEDDISGIYLLDYQILEIIETFKEQLDGLKQNPLERNDSRTLDSRLREMISCFNERSICMKGCRNGAGE